MKHFYFLMILIGSWSCATSQQAEQQAIPDPPQAKIENLEIPSVSGGQSIVRHDGYALLYDEKYEQAAWVAYELTAAETVKKVERKDHFREDPDVQTGSATLEDYEGSGYDRGHLAPAGDLTWSFASMDESFYMSNMSPQVPSFNRGVWKRLEALVRDWANDYGSIYVVTGPVLSGELPTIGQNQVAVPQLYYKVVLDNVGDEVHAIGFLLKNEASSADLQQFVVAVDSVEQLTGIDFFAALPDGKEAILEAEICVPCWDWKVQSSGKNTVTEEVESVQCKGKTATGAQCSRNTTSASGYCYQHESQSGVDNSGTKVQCSALTQAGNRCKRMTDNANGKCYQHQ